MAAEGTGLMGTDGDGARAAQGGAGGEGGGGWRLAGRWPGLVATWSQGGDTSPERPPNREPG